MGKVRFDISVSLDGFVAGPNDGVGNGLGDGGEALHDWVVGLESFEERHGREGGEAGADSEILDEAFRGVGAMIMGRRMFDFAVDAWGDEPPFRVPVFVVTHRGGEPLQKQGGTTYHFVPDGIEVALERAHEAAGDGDVSIAGGASVIQQCLQLGAVDEFQLHLVPLMLGDGVRLFEDLGPEQRRFEKTRVIDSTGVTHLKFEAR
jgi:dihydrofolate reductase